VLPISLLVAVSVVIAGSVVEAVAGSVVEAMKVRSGTRITRPSVIELLRMPAANKTTPIATKLSSRLAVREKC